MEQKPNEISPSAQNRTDPSFPDGAGVALAMVYAPCQSFSGLYAPDAALRHGTLFEDLYKPLAGEESQ